MELRDGRKRGLLRGLTSVCSTHAMVLRASMDQALADGSPLLVEASGNHVNHLGGHGGVTPASFKASLLSLASVAGLPPARLILGADHLGPGPWRREEAAVAMARAGAMVEAFVTAGYRKLHLDTSVACADDPPALAETTAARRAAALCLRAERSFEACGEGHPPVYVLGAEAPASGSRVRLTTPEELERTLDCFQDALAREGVRGVWERTVALVVQPGVEFGESSVHPYDRKKARHLVKAIAGRAPWMFEAYATDYQEPKALRELVEDGFGILKVGPWLTYACREALFALEDLARDLHGADPGRDPVQLRVVLDQAMRRHPKPWTDHQGSPRGQAYARLFSYSDRSRYYWGDPEVDAEVSRLLEATAGPLPSQLLSLHLPLALDAVVDGDLAPNGRAIVLHAIRRVLAHYSAACR